MVMFYIDGRGGVQKHLHDVRMMCTFAASDISFLAARCLILLFYCFIIFGLFCYFVILFFYLYYF